jgi:signal transduction histidine kinase
VPGLLLKRLLHVSPSANQLALPIVSAALTVSIFVFDTATNLEIAVEALYVVVVLMSVSFCRKSGVVLISLGCMALTILSYLLTQHGAPEAGLINDGISLVAIAATTFLALKIKSAERAATEARSLLEHISRVTTLGELTASIAHEVNQPLAATVINGNACLRWLGSNPPNFYEAQQAVERIIGDSNRASQIIARVRSLAKRSPPNRTYLHINKVIQETLQLMNGETEHNHVVLRTDLADDLPFVFGDRVQLQQVILNLVLNAIEAMSEIPQDTRILRVKTALRTPDAVVVAIQDTGSGLSSEKIDQIFDAFYSTKNGLGMGLAISRLIIEAHKGRIWAEPTAPTGAIFQFILPANAEAAVYSN